MYGIKLSMKGVGGQKEGSNFKTQSVWSVNNNNNKTKVNNVFGLKPA